MAAGCGLLSLGQGNAADPIVVQGRVLDAIGQPAGPVRLELQVSDFSSIPPTGQPAPLLLHETFAANADGTFAIHLALTPELAEAATAGSGSVSFALLSSWGHDPVTFAFLAFSRDVNGVGWAGPAPTVILQPGSPTSEDQDVPMPRPAAS